LAKIERQLVRTSESALLKQKLKPVMKGRILQLNVLHDGHVVRAVHSAVMFVEEKQDGAECGDNGKCPHGPGGFEHVPRRWISMKATPSRSTAKGLC